jgi:hypothetical protein
MRLFGLGFSELLVIVGIFFLIRYFYRRGRENENRAIATARPGPLTKAEAHAIGDAFESYVERSIFPVSDYRLVHRTPSYFDQRNGFDEAALLPDMKFSCRRTQRCFWVEAKFRTSLLEGKLEWCSYEQLLRYRAVNRTEPVLIAIGFGGVPSRPYRLFLVPLDALQYTGVYFSLVEPFEVEVNRKVSSYELWRLI